jgi:hypothetical protein
MRYRITKAYLTTLPSVVETNDLALVLQRYADAKIRPPFIGPLTYEPFRGGARVYFIRNGEHKLFAIATQEEDNAQTQK